jgi:hypothetical protein
VELTQQKANFFFLSFSFSFFCGSGLDTQRLEQIAFCIKQ